MPKFKVGDKIEKDIPGDTWTGRVVSVTSGNKGVRAVTIKGYGSEGPTWAFDESEIRLANSCAATNAKFKVGDRVKYKGNHPKIRGKSGTVSFVGIPGDDPTYLTVDMDNGEEWGAPEKDWVLSNARACNAIKVGDKVRVKGWQGIWEVTKTPPGMLEVKSDDGFVGITQVEKATPVKGANACKNAKIVTPENFSSLRVGDKVDFRKSRYYKGIGVVTKVYDEDIIDIKDDKGEILEVHSDDIMNAKACNSRNPIVAKAMNACGTAKNAVTITLDSRKRDGWVTGKVNGYDFEAKVFDEGSDFGIKSGRVSKLWMRKGDETVNYDRGWDERPKSAEAKAAYTELLRKMESLPKVMNACGTARNADGDIKPVEKEYTAAIRAVRELAVKAKSIDPRSRMYQDAVKAGTALYGGMKPNW